MGGRLKTLEEISGLRVSIKRDPAKATYRYEFYSGYLAVFTSYHYPKAKAFAKGVSVGRTC
jgi:hypothetical protein